MSQIILDDVSIEQVSIRLHVRARRFRQLRCVAACSFSFSKIVSENPYLHLHDKSGKSRELFVEFFIAFYAKMKLFYNVFLVWWGQ